MQTKSDLIHLAYTPDLSEAGSTYACRSLAYTYNRMGGTSFERLRRIAAGVAVELAFRRYLGEHAVPFDVLGATPFTEPDRYDVSLGGHRCDLKSFLITRRSQIEAIRRDPGCVLAAPALVPLDQFAAEGHRPDDLYVFAFLLGNVASARSEVERARSAGGPTRLIHPLPEAWARPVDWLPLDELALKSECAAPLTIELGGQTAGRDFVTLRLELPPRRRVVVERSFHSLAYVQVDRPPEMRVGLHSPRHGETYLISSTDWGNIWIYGLEVLLAGYSTHEEYRRRASVLGIGQPTFQYAHTRTKNLAVPLADLRPLEPLCDQVRAWAADKA
jgi:hypothetical protein